nr:hypothetical protein [Psychrobacter sp. PraFG1]UNK04672.1 hypothetical protein MN210_10575 [Psychrobacter sp. PraFG1]
MVRRGSRRQKQWDAWLAKRAERNTNPVGFESVYKVINKMAAKDALFGVDVGNVNIAVARLLSLGGGRRQVTSRCMPPWALVCQPPLQQR